MDDQRDGAFYKWLCHHARNTGWDLDEQVTMQGVTMPARRVLYAWAMIATTRGLTDAQTRQLARGLSVEPDEVTAAYKPEMRRQEMGEILDQPDLAVLDAALDQIAREG